VGDPEARPEPGIDANAAGSRASIPQAGPWSKRDILQIVALLGLTAVLTATWTLTPLGERLDPKHLADWARPWRENPLSLLFVIVAYGLLGLVGFPVTILLLAAVLVFGTPMGIAHAFVGSLAHASSGYWLGRLVTRPTLLEHLDRNGAIRRILSRHGMLSVMVLRNVPIGPFVVVNILSGATRIRYLSYLGGTAIGMLPGLLVVGLGADRLLAVLRNPGPLSLAALGVTIVAIVLGVAWLRHRLKRAADIDDQVE
jgi:uncharacterized membrane protein YdjX (TVP38/TMEM64 family)